MNFLAEIVPA